MLKTKNLVDKSVNLEHIKIKYDIKNFSRKKVYHLHNSYHLGDNVFNLILFNIIKKYIEANNIKIFYYAKNEYISQLSEFICSKNIILNSLNNKPQNSLEVWICNDFYNYVHGPKYFTISYNKYYVNFFNIVLRNLNINCSVNKLYYVDDNLKSRYERLSPKYKGFDILILNSQPLSQQYNYNKAEWDRYIVNLNKRFKILTTTKVPGILCTYDDKLTIKDIAALSTKAKVVIAINSGVVPGLLNYDTLINVKHFYIFDNRCFYSYPNFENRKLITDITVRELEKYIN
jgi:hypothetical protein